MQRFNIKVIFWICIPLSLVKMNEKNEFRHGVEKTHNKNPKYGH